MGKMKNKKTKKIISLAIIIAFAAVILTSLIPFVGTIFLGNR